MVKHEALLKLLKVSLNVSGKTQDEIKSELALITKDISESDWIELARAARRNSVACLIYDSVCLIDGIPESAKKEISKTMRFDETYDTETATNLFDAEIKIWISEVSKKG